MSAPRIKLRLEQVAEILVKLIIDSEKAYEPRERDEKTVFLLKKKDKACVVVPQNLVRALFKNEHEYRKFNDVLKAADILMKSRTVKVLKQEYRNKPVLTKVDWEEHINWIRCWYYDYEELVKFINEYCKDEELKRKALKILLNLYVHTKRFSSVT